MIFDRRKFFKGLFAATAVAIVEPKITYFLPPKGGWKMEEHIYVPEYYARTVVIDTALVDEERSIIEKLVEDNKKKILHLTYAQILTPTEKGLWELKRRLLHDIR